MSTIEKPSADPIKDVDVRLLRQTRQVAARFRSVRLLTWLGVVWLATAVVAAGLLWVETTGRLYVPQAAWLIGAVAGIVALVASIAAMMSFRNLHSVAGLIEHHFPGLQQRLLTALSLRPSARDGRFGFLQRAVIGETLRHAWIHRWTSVVPTGRMVAAHGWHWCALAAAVVALVQLGRFEPSAEQIAALESKSETVGASAEFEVVIEPGNTEVEKGTNLIVVARFAKAVPLEATLVSAGAASGAQRVDMTRSLDDPLFGGTVREVVEELTYHVEFAGRQSETYRVTIFEYPELLRSDAVLSFPGYTGLESKTIEDTRRVSVVEGTTLAWICHLNKPVATARLIDEAGEKLPLAADESNPQQYSGSVVVDRSRRWKLQLIDDKGRENKLPFELVAQALPNQPPELKALMAREARVSPLEEFPVQASYWDDFGLKQFGLTYSLGDAEPRDVVLGESTARRENREARHLVDFEALAAEPDQLFSYHFWAEDVGPSGAPRRVYSDLFFAEIRHFEEIFREAEQQPGGQGEPQGQSAQQAQELVELQKQIIDGTWNVIRRETAATPSDPFDDDVKLLRDSQATALEQVDALSQRITDPRSSAYVDQVVRQMQTAIKHLTTAFDQPSIASLQPALTAERASYQALLKLQAREHQVTRGQPGAAGQGGQNWLQDQIQELELSQEDNPYETVKPAQEQDPQQRELQQVINRLRDLARRQQDINEQLKQLQTALQAATTPEEKEHIQEQLKRLREQQEQLLRDTDELLDRMDRPQNQQQMSESREQLEQTRENVRESSEALQQGQVSQALSAGTRAEREFEQMRDDFRNKAAHEFSEEMRDMVERARQLDERQQEIGQSLEESQQPQVERRLSDESNRDEITKDLQTQRERLEQLLEQMKQTVEQAETSEPLLAQKLYDAYRETIQRNIDQRLEAVDRLLDRGLAPQARELEQEARAGISDLRKDVEEAAESVLGDELETLRRAVSQLDELSRQLNEEIDQADPKSRGNNRDAQSQQDPSSQSPGENQSPSGNEQPGDRPADNQKAGEQGTQPSESPSDQSQPGQPPAQESQSGESQPSLSQSGQPQSGQPQDGQSQSGERPSNSDSPSPSPGQPQDSSSQSPADNNSRTSQNADPTADGASWGGADQNSRGVDLRRLADQSQRAAPLTGDDYLQWSDQLRDIEEMLEDRDLRNEAARVRDRARDFRGDYKRHGKEPQWSLVRTLVAEPLEELRQQVSEELLRRSAARNELVPIDRDPVPDQFADRVRRYYEQLGSGK